VGNDGQGWLILGGLVLILVAILAAILLVSDNPNTTNRPDGPQPGDDRPPAQ
jgi:hypothetical protein